MNRAWTCGCCGSQFNTLPLEFASRTPDRWFQIPESECQQRGKLDADVCIIDGEKIFVCGCLEIPIIGQDDYFIWGAWGSVSKDGFARILELWYAPLIDTEPPKFGWLCNNLSLSDDPKSRNSLEPVWWRQPTIHRA
jgi:hypothetical protein